MNTCANDANPPAALQILRPKTGAEHDLTKFVTNQIITSFEYAQHHPRKRLGTLRRQAPPRALTKHVVNQLLNSQDCFTNGKRLPVTFQDASVVLAVKLKALADENDL